MHFAELVSDRAYVLEKGQICYQASMAELAANEEVRRYLSRFFVVVIVALAIEGLVATFKALHDDLALLPYAAALLAATGLLLAAWGLFVWLNRAAEELEPEAMADAKREDDKLK